MQSLRRLLARLFGGGALFLCDQIKVPCGSIEQEGRPSYDEYSYDKYVPLIDSQEGKVSKCMLLPARRRFGHSMQVVLGLLKRPQSLEAELYCRPNAASAAMVQLTEGKQGAP